MTPEERWAVGVMSKVDDLRRDVASLATLVSDLNEIARKCFDQCLAVTAENHQLREAHKQLEARVTLLEGHGGNGAAES